MNEFMKNTFYPIYRSAEELTEDGEDEKKEDHKLQKTQKIYIKKNSKSHEIKEPKYIEIELQDQNNKNFESENSEGIKSKKDCEDKILLYNKNSKIMKEYIDEFPDSININDSEENISYDEEDLEEINFKDQPRTIIVEARKYINFFRKAISDTKYEINDNIIKSTRVLSDREKMNKRIKELEKAIDDAEQPDFGNDEFLIIKIERFINDYASYKFEKLTHYFYDRYDYAFYILVRNFQHLDGQYKKNKISDVKEAIPCAELQNILNEKNNKLKELSEELKNANKNIIELEVKKKISEVNFSKQLKNTNEEIIILKESKQEMSVNFKELENKFASLENMFVFQKTLLEKYIKEPKSDDIKIESKGSQQKEYQKGSELNSNGAQVLTNNKNNSNNEKNDKEYNEKELKQINSKVNDQRDFSDNKNNEKNNQDSQNNNEKNNESSQNNSQNSGELFSDPQKGIHHYQLPKSSSNLSTDPQIQNANSPKT